MNEEETLRQIDLNGYVFTPQCMLKLIQDRSKFMSKIQQEQKATQEMHTLVQLWRTRWFKCRKALFNK